MATREEQIIIDIEFNAGETEQKLGDVAKQIETLKTRNKEIRQELKSGTGDWASLTAQLKSNEQEIKSLQVAEKDLAGMISVADQQRRKYSDSFRGQAAQLADLKNQYASLTKAERESAGGKEMLQKLQQLDEQVKENDKSMGNFQRNVGNYPQVFDLSGTAIGRLQTTLQGLGGTASTVGGVAGNAFAGMKAQAISLGKAFLTLPIGAIVIVLGAILLAVQKLSAAFKKNDDAGTKLQQAFAQFKPIAEGIAWVFDKIAVVVANLIYGFSKMATAVLNLIPAYKKSAKAAEELVLAQDKLEDKENEYTVNSAKRNREIARLKKELTQTEKYTAAEREKIAKQIDNLELENLNENRKILAEKYNNLVKYYKQEKDTSDAAKKAKADAYAAFINADTQYFEATTRVSSRLNAARKEQREKDEANEKEERERAEQRRKEADDKRLQREKENTDFREKQTAEFIKNTDAEIAKMVEAANKAKAALDFLKKSIEEEAEQEADISGIEKYLDDIQKAKESIASENEILELERQQSLLDAEYQAAVENARKVGASTELIDEEYALKRKKIFEATTAANLSNASDFAGNLATIFGESTKLGKAAAAAQVAIDTYKGALAAYSAAASIPVVGQALGIAAAAAVTVKGTKAIKDIYAVKDSFSAGRFATGGIVGGRSYTGDAITARVNSGEMILNLQQQKKLFDTIANGSIGAQQGIDYDLLAKAMSKQPAPVIGMKEFLSYREKIATFDEQIKI